MDSFARLALAWLLLYLCVRYVGLWLWGRFTRPADPTPASPSHNSPGTVLVARRRIGSAPAAIVNMSQGAFAALVMRRTRSKLRVRASSRANRTSLRVAGYARRGGSTSVVQPR